MTQTRPRPISVSDLLALNNRLRGNLNRSLDNLNRSLDRSLNHRIRHNIIQRLSSRSQHSQRATQILASRRSSLKSSQFRQNLIFRLAKLNHNAGNSLCTRQSRNLNSF